MAQKWKTGRYLSKQWRYIMHYVIISRDWKKSMAVCRGFCSVRLCFRLAYVVTKLQHIRRYNLKMDSDFSNLIKYYSLLYCCISSHCFDSDKFATCRSCYLFWISEIDWCSRKPVTKITQVWNDNQILTKSYLIDCIFELAFGK